MIALEYNDKERKEDIKVWLLVDPVTGSNFITLGSDAKMLTINPIAFKLANTD